MQQARGGGKYEVRRGSGNDDEIDLRSRDTGCLHGALTRGHGKLAGGDIGSGKVTRANAGALDDPFVGSVDAACDEIVVGNRRAGQKAAGAGNS